MASFVAFDTQNYYHSHRSVFSDVVVVTMQNLFRLCGATHRLDVVVLGVPELVMATMGPPDAERTCAEGGRFYYTVTVK